VAAAEAEAEAEGEEAESCKLRAAERRLCKVEGDLSAGDAEAEAGECGGSLGEERAVSLGEE
jgi:hypothetical protein